MLAKSGGVSELWKSDGTALGTVKIKQIRSGRPSDGPDLETGPGPIVSDGTLFFSGRSEGTGLELWKPDGTAKGTMMVKNINPGIHGSEPQRITRIGDSVLFAAQVGDGGVGLWKSDGTAAGTVRIKAVEPHSSGTYHTTSDDIWLAVSGGSAFFSSGTDAKGDGLWKTDGTEEGTVLVKDITEDAGPVGISQLTGVDGSVFFTAGRVGDEVGPGESDLWYSDGTAEGTEMLEDFVSGECCGDLTAVGDSVVFNAKTILRGSEMWKSDGTKGGTEMVKDIRPGFKGGQPKWLHPRRRQDLHCCLVGVQR